MLFLCVKIIRGVPSLRIFYTKNSLARRKNIKPSINFLKNKQSPKI